MNRTQEFRQIIYCFPKSQMKCTVVFHKNSLIAMQPKLEEILLEIRNKFNLLNKRRIQEKIDEAEKELSSHTFSFKTEYDNMDEENVYKKISEIERNQKRQNVVLLQKCLEAFSNKILSFKENQSAYVEDQHLNQLILEEQQIQGLLENTKVRQRTDLEIRKEKMQEQLNELGQIVCDISMHIQAQGENIERIDEMVNDTGDFLKRNLYEIKRIEKMISKNRKNIIKFFLVLMAFLVIRIFLKKL